EFVQLLHAPGAKAWFGRTSSQKPGSGRSLLPVLIDGPRLRMLFDVALAVERGELGEHPCAFGCGALEQPLIDRSGVDKQRVDAVVVEPRAASPERLRMGIHGADLERARTSSAAGVQGQHKRKRGPPGHRSDRTFRRAVESNATAHSQDS